jgi:hypothetical protein
VRGRLSKVWTEEEMGDIRQHIANGFWGKGINRRTGKRAKKK